MHPACVCMRLAATATQQLWLFPEAIAPEPPDVFAEKAGRPQCADPPSDCHQAGLEALDRWCARHGEAGAELLDRAAPVVAEARCPICGGPLP